MKRHLTAISLAVLTLTACGKDDPTPSAPNNGNNQAGNTEVTDTVTIDTPNDKPDDTPQEQTRADMVDLSGYDNAKCKRGICYNKLNEDVVGMMTSGNVGWSYNWASKSDYPFVGAKQEMKFAPMIWDDFRTTTDIESNLKRNPGAEILLSFNEPMMTSKDGGCQMTPKRAAELWPEVERIAEEYGLKIVSPALTYGYESIGGKVYGTPEAWMDAFVSEHKNLYGREPHYDYLGLHSYMNWPEAVVGYVDKYAKRYGVKVYLTEFCAWGHNSDAWDDIYQLEKNKYKDFSYQRMTMTQKIEAMDQDDNVAGYAWFMADGNKDKEPWNALYSGNELTTLGKIYSYLSNSNKEKYYEPGKYIPAVQYVSSSNYNNEASKKYDTYLLFDDNTDSEFAEVIPIELKNLVSGRFVNYQIDVPTDGEYAFTLRYLSNGQMDVKITADGKTTSQSAASTNGEWTDQTIVVALKSGKQTVKIAANGTAKDVRLCCLMFEKAE